MNREALGSQSPRRGRPRKAATDSAIIRAALEVITEVGIQRTTLTAVAARAGVARATVYLRWPTRSALFGAVIRSAVGGQPLPLSGKLEEDIRFAAGFVQQVFEHPAIRAVLPEIVRAALAEPPEIDARAVAPRREPFGREYIERAAIEGFDDGASPHLVWDAMVGTAITSLLFKGRPMTRDEATELAEVLIAGLRAD